MSLFNNFVQLFGRGSKTQVVDAQQASQLIRNVDEMLDESRKMLTGFRGKVPATEFESIDFQHNQLYLMVVDVKSDIRERQGNKVFFASTAERDRFYVQIRQILTRCQIHHNDVLTVSRKTYQRNLPLQAGDFASITPSSVSTMQEDGSKTEWLSIVSESASDLSMDEVDSSSLSESGSESSAQQFIATMAHIPKSALATEEELLAQLPDDDSYYRILICGNKRKQAVVVDTKAHPMSASYDDEDAERSQDEILRVGDMMMKSDPKQLQGHQVVESYRGPSFISSFISSWNYNSLPLGGMV